MSDTTLDLGMILTHLTPVAVNAEIQRWSTTHTITTHTINEVSLSHQDGTAHLQWDLVTLHTDPGQQHRFHHLHHHGQPSTYTPPPPAFYREHHMTQASQTWSASQAELEAALSSPPATFDAATYLRRELDLPNDACLAPMGYTVCDCPIC